MRKLLWVFALVLVISGWNSLSAQIVIGQDTLYGHEWIVPEQSYLKFQVTEDDFYRITYEELSAAGWPVESISSDDFQLIHQGEPVFFHASNNWSGPLSSGDYLIFRANKNRGELDHHLYRLPDEEQLNPRFSLYTDTSSYFLSWIQDGGTNIYQTIPNDISSPPSPAPYVWQRSEVVFSEHFMKEYYRVSGQTLYNSHMGIGEGFGSRSVNELLASGSVIQEVELPLDNLAEGAAAPILQTRYVVPKDTSRRKIQVLSVNGELVRQDTAYSWNMYNVETNLPDVQLSGSSATVRWEGLYGPTDEVSVGFVAIEYPAIPTANEQNIYEAIIRASGLAQYIVVTGIEGSLATAYDVNTGQRIQTEVTNGQLEMLWPSSEEDRHIFVFTDELSLPTLPATTVQLDLPNTNDADYLVLTSNYLRNNGDQVQAYADYRASTTGGGFKTAVINTEDLYDLFGYGVNHHSIAVRNFIAWERRRNPNFEFLFIIGKGREYKDLRNPDQLDAALGATFFVPTFGFPGSDTYLTATLDLPLPQVAQGRLSAINSTEIEGYLMKVMELEANLVNAEQSIAGKSWAKNLLHLGGGATPGEQQSIRYNLNTMQGLVENSTFGGQVRSFFKTTTDPIQEALTSSIFERINEGVSVISFFGHSSTNTFDFSIDNPENYSNRGKYPLMLSLGCYSGNAFSAGRGVGERFIGFENKGAIAFGASRGLGFITSLGDFGQNFYRLMSGELYGEPIGNILRQNIANYANRSGEYLALTEQFILQGDPAIRLNPFDGPDFTIESNSLSFSPAIINLSQDSFQVSFDVYNLGKASVDSLDISIHQQLPNGTEVIVKALRVEAPKYRTAIITNIATQGKTSIGLNRLFITLDPQQIIAELPAASAEANNDLLAANGEAGATFFVIDNNAYPAWPPEYALIGEEPHLVANTADPLAEERTYLLELSEDWNFNTVTAQTSIRQAGGVINWSPDVNWADSTVYYWRITPDSTEVGLPDYSWEGSSFMYIADEPFGWAQGDFGQYRDNQLTNLETDIEAETIDFVSDFRTLMIRNNIYTIGNSQGFRPEGQVNNRRWSDFFRWNVRPSLQVVVVDTVGRFLRNENPGEYGSINTSTPNAIACFSFPVLTPEARTNILTFLTEVIPDGYTVLVYNAIRTPTQDLAVSDWVADSITNAGLNIFNVLEMQGATKIRQLMVGPMRPYYVAYVKGGGVLQEEIATSQEETIINTLDIEGRWTFGNMQSRRIGPAMEWSRLFWKGNTVASNDTILVDLIGVTSSGEEAFLQSVKAHEGSIDLSDISASLYPYVYLQYNTEDRIEYTSPQLAYWKVHYTPLPDLAIDGAAGYAFNADTLQQGQLLSIALPVTNISSQAIDSTRLVFSLGALNTTPSIWEETIPSLLPGESYITQTSAPTANYRGDSQITISLNPDNQPTERLLLNNQSVIELYLKADEIAPVADITFDGVSIFDGDLVSAKPAIAVKVEDENLYLLLDDPDLVELSLIDPNGGTNIIDVTEGLLYDLPTEATPNELLLSWNPHLELDGEYLIRLTAKDRSGNFAGRLLLEKSFNVINEQSISHVLPYPNPFTTQAQFVYTLTGDRPPDRYRIDIMTISGRMVRSIDQWELGPLKVGTHRTDFAWDGTDMYGDRLANGTYLYRFIVEDESGQTVKQYENDQLDPYFLSGLGKIVLLR